MTETAGKALASQDTMANERMRDGNGGPHRGSDCDSFGGVIKRHEHGESW